MGESLLAVGGRKIQSREAVSTILRFRCTPDSDGSGLKLGNFQCHRMIVSVL